MSSMKNVFFVTPTQFEMARNMEKKLLALPKESGILFVGVSIQEGKEETKPIFKVIIGCSREREPNVVVALAKHYLRSFVKDEWQIQAEAFRGVTISS